MQLDSATLCGTYRGQVASHPAARRVEAMLVMARAKPMLLDHGPEEYVSALAAWAQARGMTALLSPYEFTPVREEARGGYSNSMEGIRPARAGSGAWRSVLAALEPGRVMLGWCCLLRGWDGRLGVLLGYPECCAAAYPARWERAKRESRGDVAAAMLSEWGLGYAGPFGWEANVFARYLGFELIQHFPCRPDCDATLRLARRNLAALRAFAPEIVEQAVRVLGAPVAFARNGGVAVFPGGLVMVEGGECVLTFDPRAALATGPLRPAVEKAEGRIEVTQSGFEAGGTEFDGWLIDFQKEAER